jgi:hypothetical protein
MKGQITINSDLLRSPLNLDESLFLHYTDAPDFEHAVVRHKLIEAMERSHNEGKVIHLD